jgi:hypothetical protein
MRRDEQRRRRRRVWHDAQPAGDSAGDCPHQGGAVQVDTLKPMLKAPGFQRLKLHMIMLVELS